MLLMLVLILRSFVKRMVQDCNSSNNNDEVAKLLKVYDGDGWMNEWMDGWIDG